MSASSGTTGTDTTGTGGGGPLDGVAARRLAESSVAVIATADRNGDRDVTVLAGPRCFLRALDGRRFAWPDEGEEAVCAYRSNLAESPRLAVLALAPGADGSRAALHLNGTAEVVTAGALRTDHPDLPANPVPGQYTDVWVVVDVGDAYVLDGDDVPPVGLLDAAAPAPAAAPTVVEPRPAQPPPPAETARPAETAKPAEKAPPAETAPPAKTAQPAEPPRRADKSGSGSSGGRRFGLPVVAGLLALVLLLLVALVATTLTLSGGGTTGGTTADAPRGPAGPVVARGRVIEVPDVSTVVVDLDGTPTRYGVVGLGAPVPPCAAAAALDFARTTLQGKTATLVPDPTLPPSPEPRAYIVLETQLSYTDAAIGAGWAVPAGDAQYRAVFDREQADARAAGRGMWGPPCVP